MTQAKMKALCVNLDETLPFLRSVSYAQVAQSTTRMEWVDQKEGLLPLLYSAMGGLFGTPGTVEVRSAPDARIREEVDKLTQHRIDVLFQKCEMGPSAVAKYLADQEELRAYCMKAIQNLYADASAINQEIAGAWGDSIIFLSRIKLASTVTVKALGQIPGPGWAISLGYDITVGTIDDLSQAGEARGVVAVASENAMKESAKEAGGRAAQGAANKLNKMPTDKELGHALVRMKQLDEKLHRQMRTLRSRQADMAMGVGNRNKLTQSINSLNKQIVRNTDNLSAAQKGALRAGAKHAAAKAVGWLFLAGDIMEAFNKHDSAVTNARR